MAKDACIFYKSYYEAIQKVPEEYRLEIYNAIFMYAIEETEPANLSPVSEAIFTLIKPNLDSSSKRYETNVNNGKKGGRPKAETQQKPNNNPKETQQEPKQNLEKEKEKEKEIEIEKEIDKKIHFAEYVTMTNAEYEKLVSTHSKEFADQCITKLDNYKGSNGKTYKSDYRAILSWVVKEIEEENTKKRKQQDNIRYLEDGTYIKDGLHYMN